MTLWRGKYPLILASQSRARQMLLANAGIDFEAVPAEIDERAVQQSSGLNRRATSPLSLRAKKPFSVSLRQAGQICCRRGSRPWRLAQRLFRKPAGRAQAAEQLRALAGRSHELHSAVAVARDGKILFEAVASSRE